MIQAVKHFFNLRSAFLFLADGILIFFSVLFILWLRLPRGVGFYPLDEITVSNVLLFTLICQLCIYFANHYSLKKKLQKKEVLTRLFQSFGIAGILLSVVTFIFPSFLIEQEGAVLPVVLIFSPLLLVLSRQYYTLLLERSPLNQRVMIIGSGSLAKEIGLEIRSNKSLEYHLVQFYEEQSSQPENGTIFDVARKNHIDKLIYAPFERRGTVSVDELLKCKLAGLDIQDGLAFYEKMTGKIAIDQLKPSFLVFSNGFKTGAATRVVKRAVDLLFSVSGLILALPFFLLVPLFIRLDSRGPIFYKQVRLGEKGKPFTLLKFRSMRVDAEAVSGAVWAKDNDPRITRVGKFIRKTRVDEIPQLFNVLKGEMSLVGPRPERPVFVEQLTHEIPYYPLRHLLKPGITGWAQIKYPYGSSVKDAQEKLQFDLYYTKSLSLSFDLAILFSTIKVVLSTRGAK